MEIELGKGFKFDLHSFIQSFMFDYFKKCYYFFGYILI